MGGGIWKFSLLLQPLFCKLKTALKINFFEKKHRSISFIKPCERISLLSEREWDVVLLLELMTGKSEKK